MRTRGLAILTVAVLAFSACQASHRPSSFRRPTGQRGAGCQRTGRQRRPVDRGRRRCHRHAPDALARRPHGDLAPGLAGDVQPGDQLPTDVRQAARAEVGHGRLLVEAGPRPRRHVGRQSRRPDLDVPPPSGRQVARRSGVHGQRRRVHGQPRAAEHRARTRRTPGPPSSASTRSPIRTRSHRA